MIISFWYNSQHFLDVLLLQSVPAYKSMLDERKKLPAWKSQQNIIETLQQHQVVVISGMTG